MEITRRKFLGISAAGATTAILNSPFSKFLENCAAAEFPENSAENPDAAFARENIYEMREKLSWYAVRAGKVPLENFQIEKQLNSPKENPAGIYWICREIGGSKYFCPYLPAAELEEIQKSDEKKDKTFLAQNYFGPTEGPFSKINAKILNDGDLFYVSQIGDEIAPIRLVAERGADEITGAVSGGILSSAVDHFANSAELFENLRILIARYGNVILKAIAENDQKQIAKFLKTEGLPNGIAGNPKLNWVASLQSFFGVDSNLENRETLKSFENSANVRPEYSGSGKSPASENPTIQNLGAHSFNALSGLKMTKDFLQFAGHSMGGGNAMIAALKNLRAGKKVELTLSNTACFPMESLVFPFNLLQHN
jgi:hypothetical protein